MFEVGHQRGRDAAVRAQEELIHVLKEDVLTVCQFGRDAVGGAKNVPFGRGFFAAGKDGEDEDLRLRQFVPQRLHDRGNPRADFFAGVKRAVVLADHDDGDLGGDAVDVAVLKPPEDLLGAIAGDAKDQAVPGGVVVIPHGFSLPLPVPDDRIADVDEINIALTRPCVHGVVTGHPGLTPARDRDDRGVGPDGGGGVGGGELDGDGGEAGQGEDEAEGNAGGEEDGQGHGRIVMRSGERASLGWGWAARLRFAMARRALVFWGLGVRFGWGRRWRWDGELGQGLRMNLPCALRWRGVPHGRWAMAWFWMGVLSWLRVSAEGVVESAVPSFRREVLPLLTRAGCNQGACHGKLAGQNGFRLSLRGYAPELDHRWITGENASRRIDPADPDASLLITKPLGRVPHEGLVRFEEGSREHRTLRAWIAARAPGPKPLAEEPDPVRLEVVPGDGTFRVGETRSLGVHVHWPDGKKDEVTWLTQFFSNDETVARVTTEGVVTALREGETAVRVHYHGLVGVVRVTVPADREVEPWRFGVAKNAVDAAVFERLKALHIPPSPRCDDATFLRRVMLDVIGTLPTPEELALFLGDRGEDKRGRWIEAILKRREFADHWTLQLADLLQNRRERDHDVRGVKGVRGFHAWLHGRLESGVGWDVIAREVLTARGDAFQNPAVGYHVTLVGEKSAVESEVTDSVAQAFLGTRIGCARCHNHPLERYTQDDFHRFAAFFSQVTVERREPDKGASVLRVESAEHREWGKRMEAATRRLQEAQARLLEVEAGGRKEAQRHWDERRREHAQLKREGEEMEARPPRAMQPRTREMLEARPLDRKAMRWVPGGDPRERLAEWIVSKDNPLFAQAMVNRLWKHFMGVGLVEPVDDLRASNPPSNPALMELLAREFRESGHDLRHVMRLILNSRAYQLSSMTIRGNETDRRFHSHYLARRLPAEVLADAVAEVTGIPERYDGQPMGVRAIQLPEPQTGSYFLSLFGRSDRVTACACERKGEVTLPQLLHLRNGGETQRRLGDRDGRIHRLARRKGSLGESVAELYRVALSRTPTTAELDAILPTLNGVPAEDALRDVAWALLNSKEFNFNH